MLAPSLQIEQFSRCQLTLQLANTELNFTFEALHRYLAGHFVPRQFFPGGQYDPNYFQSIGFDNGPGTRGSLARHLAAAHQQPRLASHGELP